MSKDILGGLVLPDFKAIGGKTMWYWCRARGVTSESSESSETDPVYNGHLVQDRWKHRAVRKGYSQW